MLPYSWIAARIRMMLLWPALGMAWRGPSDRRAVALTFDDGPSESTPRLLETLAAHQVRATFFLCGHHVRRWPDIARMVRDAGHEIGNHGDGHPCYLFKTAVFIRADVEGGRRVIAEATSVRPVLFRPPYGVRWFGLRRIEKELGLLGVHWTVIGRDWKWDSRRVADHVLKRAGNGAIICLHDGRSLATNPDIRSTLGAVAELVPRLKERSFEFDTAGGLLRDRLRKAGLAG